MTNGNRLKEKNGSCSAHDRVRVAPVGPGPVLPFLHHLAEVHWLLDDLLAVRSKAAAVISSRKYCLMDLGFSHMTEF